MKEVADIGIVPAVSIAVQRTARLRGIARWLSRDALQAGELVASAQEYLNLLLLLDVNAIALGGRELERVRNDLAAVSVWVGEVDVALSVASLRAGPDYWSSPAWTNDTRTTLVNARHPVLRDAVPNSIVLEPGKGIILTGSNMSGKSTLLRTAGVCAVFADALNICPAESYSGPPIEVRACIGRSDNLLEGKSYYVAEVEAVLSIVRANDGARHRLLLFDELFRGTNTVERLAAGEAVLRALLTETPGIAPTVIVATHDTELVAMLRGLYTPYHMRESVDGGALNFEYRLHPGPATTRTALRLLELHGAPATLMDRAHSLARMLDERRDSRALLQDPGD
jgi:DNA mismatch repair ATPase MutS